MLRQGEFVRMSIRFASVCLAAALVGSPALALNPGNAWTRGGAPLAANAYFAPPGVGQGATAAANEAPPAYAQAGNPGGILDEVRLGGTTFWQHGDNGSEGGLYLTGQILFDPFVRSFDNRILDVLLRPRPHIGMSLSTDSGSSQLYAGLTWTVPLPSILFLEASFGGTVHDAHLENNPIAVGCRFLFRESIGLGVELGPHWRVIGGIDHSSHANLCGNENDGLTHIGGSIGYRF